MIMDVILTIRWRPQPFTTTPYLHLLPRTCIIRIRFTTCLNQHNIVEPIQRPQAPDIILRHASLPQLCTSAVLRSPATVILVVDDTHKRQLQPCALHSLTPLGTQTLYLALSAVASAQYTVPALKSVDERPWECILDDRALRTWKHGMRVPRLLKNVREHRTMLEGMYNVPVFRAEDRPSGPQYF